MYEKSEQTNKNCTVNILKPEFQPFVNYNFQMVQLFGFVDH